MVKGAVISLTLRQVAAHGDMKTKDLSSRWLRHGAEFVRISKLTAHFSESPFDRTPAGLLDFRGLHLRGDLSPEDRGLRQVKGADFTSSSFKHTAILGWTFVSCHFDKVDFVESVRLEDCAFKSCTFVGTKGGAFFPVRCRFEDCVFEDLKLSSKTAFIECNIDGGRFATKRLQVQFSGGTTIDRTVFSGELFQCGFEGIAFTAIPREPNGDLAPLRPEQVLNKMHQVDFSSAVLRKCGFAYCVDLSEIIPPSKTYNCVVYVNREFTLALQACIDLHFTNPDEREMANRLANMDYREDRFNKFRVAHIDDELKYQGQEFSSMFFSCICKAAEQTQTRIVGHQ